MGRIRIIDRYIFRELVGPFFLGLATITLVLFIQKMFRLADLVISKGVSFGATLELFLLILPGFLVITIPMSTLLASLIAFTRLSSDSEITALKASCISLYGMLRPVALLSAISCLVTAVISLAVLPGSNQALKEHMFSLVKSSAMVAIEPGIFTSKFNGLVIYVDKMKSADDLEGIFLSDERSGKDAYVITAKRGKLIADPKSLDVVLVMEEGVIHAAMAEKQPYIHSSFNAGRLFMDINNFFISAGQLDSGFKHVGSLDLLRQIRQARRDSKPAESMASEFHTRLIIPFACLVFGLVGAPLGIRRARSGKSAGVVTAILIFLGYYIILGSSKNFAESGALPAAAAYWIPNILIAAAAAAVIYSKGHEIQFRAVVRIGTWAGLLRERLKSAIKR
jgi:lipopolysaccharide export system permease protein